MAAASHPLAISKSAVDDYRYCEQLYSYKYVDRLRRRDRSYAPELGIILHAYMDVFYQALKDGESAEDAHVQAQASLTAKFVPDIRKYAIAAHRAGNDNLAVVLNGLPAVVGRVTTRYFQTRGRIDADTQEILLVEEPLTMPITKSIVSNGRIDLVTRSKETGVVLGWEHKSAKDIPQSGIRLRDLQLALYFRKLAAMDICPPIDAGCWNYLLTIEPVQPAILQSGKPTVAKTKLNTTWEVYQAVLEELDLDEADYLQVKLMLQGRELSHYFPRYIQPVVSDVDILMRDYRRTALDIKLSRRLWAEGKREPVRVLNFRCDWCEMAPLCNAAILAGDDRDIRELRYTVSS